MKTDLIEQTEKVREAAAIACGDFDAFAQATAEYDQVSDKVGIFREVNGLSVSGIPPQE
jgi:hypothetical protein